MVYCWYKVYFCCIRLIFPQETGTEEKSYISQYFAIVKSSRSGYHAPSNGGGGTGSKSRYGERKTHTPSYAYEWEHSRVHVFMLIADHLHFFRCCICLGRARYLNLTDAFLGAKGGPFDCYDKLIKCWEEPLSRCKECWLVAQPRVPKRLYCGGQ